MLRHVELCAAIIDLTGCLTVHPYHSSFSGIRCLYYMTAAPVEICFALSLPGLSALALAWAARGEIVRIRKNKLSHFDLDARSANSHTSIAAESQRPSSAACGDEGRKYLDDPGCKFFECQSHTPQVSVSDLEDLGDERVY